MSNLVGSVNCHVSLNNNYELLTKVRIVRYRVTVSGTGEATLECKVWWRQTITKIRSA